MGTKYEGGDSALVLGSCSISLVSMMENGEPESNIFNFFNAYVTRDWYGTKHWSKLGSVMVLRAARSTWGTRYVHTKEMDGVEISQILKRGYIRWNGQKRSRYIVKMYSSNVNISSFQRLWIIHFRGEWHRSSWISRDWKPIMIVMWVARSTYGTKYVDTKEIDVRLLWGSSRESALDKVSKV